MAAGQGIAALAAVLAASGNEGMVPAVAVVVVSLAVALLAARAAVVLVRRAFVAPVGALVAAVACAVLAVTPRGVITIPASAVLGAGVGIAAPRVDDVERRTGVLAALAGVVEIVVLRVVAGPIAALWWAVVLVVVLTAATTIRAPRHGARLGRTGVAFVTVAAVLAGGLVAWVGGNDPTVEWFGHVITHGDRSKPMVALTFDDGPDDPFTLEVSQILDAHGVKGTFFEVGKAIDARPDIVRALQADGQLVGNHSYHHDYWRWLDPWYPELDRTQAAFARGTGQCPAFFRPPHGQRTPFMLARVRDRGMHAVTWDVSAQDWSETDGTVVARNIVDRARPGSIILLHDGLDGNVGADRSVLRTALPLILDGLRAKGLQPVRLDQLLGLPGYLDRC